MRSSRKGFFKPKTTPTIGEIFDKPTDTSWGGFSSFPLFSIYYDQSENGFEVPLDFLVRGANDEAGKINVSVLDTYYLDTRYDKKIGPTLSRTKNIETIESNDTIENSQIFGKICSLISSKYSRKWNRFYELQMAKYNPIANYDMEEKYNESGTTNKTGSQDTQDDLTINFGKTIKEDGTVSQTQNGRTENNRDNTGTNTLKRQGTNTREDDLSQNTSGEVTRTDDLTATHKISEKDETDLLKNSYTAETNAENSENETVETRDLTGTDNSTNFRESTDQTSDTDTEDTNKTTTVTKDSVTSRAGTEKTDKKYNTTDERTDALKTKEERDLDEQRVIEYEDNIDSTRTNTQSGSDKTTDEKTEKNETKENGTTDKHIGTQNEEINYDLENTLTKGGEQTVEYSGTEERSYEKSYTETNNETYDNYKEGANYTDNKSFTYNGEKEETEYGKTVTDSGNPSTVTIETPIGSETTTANEENFRNGFNTTTAQPTDSTTNTSTLSFNDRKTTTDTTNITDNTQTSSGTDSTTKSGGHVDQRTVQGDTLTKSGSINNSKSYEDGEGSRDLFENHHQETTSYNGYNENDKKEGNESHETTFNDTHTKDLVTTTSISSNVTNVVEYGKTDTETNKGRNFKIEDGHIYNSGTVTTDNTGTQTTTHTGSDIGTLTLDTEEHLAGTDTTQEQGKTTLSKIGQNDKTENENLKRDTTDKGTITTKGDESMHGEKTLDVHDEENSTTERTGENTDTQTGTVRTEQQMNTTNKGTQTNTENTTNTETQDLHEKNITTTDDDISRQTTNDIVNGGKDVTARTIGVKTQDNGGHDIEHTLTRTGNIGVTTTAQMITQELELWNSFDLMDIICSDLDEILTLSVY